ncbi:MAG: hypothetical protein PHT07_21055 [Paludibacter sp.]|nr:hypothetical protein [Paludibacter sp.]
MKKINALNSSVKWNGSLYDPRLVITFTRTEESSDWHEIHIRITPEFVRDISLALKKYIAAWWQNQQKTLESIQEHLKF